MTFRRTGQIRPDFEGAARAIADAAIKHVKSRVASDVDARGRAFPGYSELYQEQLAAIGEPTSPAARLAKLVEGLRVVRLEIGSNGLINIAIGVGGSSTSKPRPPPWVFSPSKTPEQRARALEGWRSSSKKPPEPLSNAAKVAIAASSGPHRAPRILLGISPEGMKEIARILQRYPLFK